MILENSNLRLLPVIPISVQYNGLARDVIMWTRFDGQSGASLHAHLKNLGRKIPAWLEDVIPDINHAPSKGAIAATIYRMMTEDFLEEYKNV